ncbi:hypothetical protein, conserved [Eimeria necatrix]|uniref:Uncharacterized protein n=1 Tax=Eimeria necatrix TaxID=51315 RepID=U6N5X2_9EIME|nr:hypothetical protein, conserved [Eimeria necatrix]CDJ69315.1 hypothetical protein, conserved [Eimeria necatrix]
MALQQHFQPFKQFQEIKKQSCCSIRVIRLVAEIFELVIDAEQKLEGLREIFSEMDIFGALQQLGLESEGCLSLSSLRSLLSLFGFFAAEENLQKFLFFCTGSKSQRVPINELIYAIANRPTS